MDIDYYNAANPSTPWGWRVPTQADFQTLSTYLGGDAVSGGKLKKEGFDYWLSPNYADNSSGFSALGGGARNSLTGAFSAIRSNFVISGIDEQSNLIGGSYLWENNISFNGLSNYNRPKGTGFSLRLIKS